MDANEEISDQDLKIASFIHEENKPSVFVMNKCQSTDNVRCVYVIIIV